MNVNPGTTAASVTGDQDTAPRTQDEDEQVSDSATFVSKAPPENMVNGQIVEGVPVMDAHGETIGNVAAYNEGDGNIVVRGGWLFEQDTQIPLDLVGDRGASGLYLTKSKDELMQQYGGDTATSATNTDSGAMGAMGAMDRSTETGDTNAMDTSSRDTDRSTMASDTSGTTMSGMSGATDSGTDTASTEPTASMQRPTSGDTMGTTTGDDTVTVRDDSTQGVVRDMGTTES